MNSATLQSPSLSAWKSTLSVIFVTLILLGLSLSRSLNPDELMKRTEPVAQLLQWVPLVVVTVIWLLKSPSRGLAVVRLLIFQSSLGVIGLCVLGLSALWHPPAEEAERVGIAIAVLSILPVSLLFTRGFCQRRDWARKTTLILCHITVVLTLFITFFSGVKVGEVWSLLEGAAGWYCLSHPEVVNLFHTGAGSP